MEADVGCCRWKSSFSPNNEPRLMKRLVRYCLCEAAQRLFQQGRRCNLRSPMLDKNSLRGPFAKRHFSLSISQSKEILHCLRSYFNVRKPGKDNRCETWQSYVASHRSSGCRGPSCQICMHCCAFNGFHASWQPLQEGAVKSSYYRVAVATQATVELSYT